MKHMHSKTRGVAACGAKRNAARTPVIVLRWEHVSCHRCLSARNEVVR